jgi:multidrug resistance efflux pump
MRTRLAIALTLVSAATASAQDQQADVINVVEAEASVVSIKPDGSLVKKGEVVCELEPAPLKEQLAHQKLMAMAAAAGLKGAQMAREAAEMAVTEYVEGTFKRDREAAQGELALAESARKLAQERLDASKRGARKGQGSPNGSTAEQRALQRATVALEQAQTKRNVLERYTKTTTVQRLRSEVEKARADELAQRAAYEREQAAVRSLEKRIESCKIVAPISGRIRYVRPIAAGAVVRGGELLLRVIPEAGPKAEAKPK